MVFGNGVKNMQAVANNGAPTCKVAKNCGSGGPPVDQSLKKAK